MAKLKPIYISTKLELPQTSKIRKVKVLSGDGTIEIVEGYYQAVSGLNYWYMVGGNVQIHPIAWEK